VVDLSFLGEFYTLQETLPAFLSFFSEIHSSQKSQQKIAMKVARESKILDVDNN
jgi:hypothetical protein